MVMRIKLTASGGMEVKRDSLWSGLTDNLFFFFFILMFYGAKAEYSCLTWTGYIRGYYRRNEAQGSVWVGMVFFLSDGLFSFLEVT